MIGFSFMPLSMSTNFAIFIRKLGHFVQQTSLMIWVHFFRTRLLSIIVNIFFQIKFLRLNLRKKNVLIVRFDEIFHFSGNGNDFFIYAFFLYRSNFSSAKGQFLTAKNPFEEAFLSSFPCSVSHQTHIFPTMDLPELLDGHWKKGPSVYTQETWRPYFH